MRVSGFKLVSFQGLLMAFLVLAACVDKDFDAPPPGGVDPGLDPNITIFDLKQMHTQGQFEEIEEDLVIEALVISSDTEGNFYRQLVIQDQTGGIEIRMDISNLDNIYPPGRQVYVKLKGLWLGDYNNLVQLGAGTQVNQSSGDLELARIPESLADDYIARGTYGNLVEPAVKSISELGEADVSTLIALEEVEFISGDVGQTWADAEAEISLNRTLKDCSNRNIIVRTSGFASFASDTIPGGNGRLVAVLGIFNQDLQLTLRSLDEVQLDGERCQAGGGNKLDIFSLRELYNGGTGIAPEGYVQGVVISDRSTGNHVGQNLFLQDASGGIVIRFSDFHDFDLGKELTVAVTGLSLSEFNGLLQVDNTPLVNAEEIGSAELPAPRQTTINELLLNADDWESTRVRLDDVSFSGSATYGGNNGTVTLTDNSGSMIMYTRSQANFASSAVPSEPSSIIGIISAYNTPQLVINSTADVSGGGGGNGDLDEGFDQVGDNDDIALPGWTNVAVKGSRLWRGKIFDGNHYAQATAFGDDAAEMETWLVTPAINVADPKMLSFQTAKAFWTHDGLEVFSSTDFSGDVTSASWTRLDLRLAEESDNEHAWINSGDFDLSGFSGTVYIGFKYTGSGPNSQTSSFRLDNVKVVPK